jgi:hypothetical protein
MSVSQVPAVAADERRLRRCEKLTPRLPKPPERTTTGGLLGKCELARDEREIDLRLVEGVARCDGVLRFEEPRDIAELCLDLFRRAWMRNELPVRWPKAVVGRSFRLSPL